LGAEHGHLGAEHGHLGAANPEVNLQGKGYGELGKGYGELGKGYGELGEGYCELGEEFGELGAADPRKSLLGAWRTNGARDGDKWRFWCGGEFGPCDCIPHSYADCAKCGALKGERSHRQPERRRWMKDDDGIVWRRPFSCSRTVPKMLRTHLGSGATAEP
jgi:hypothetical protein